MANEYKLSYTASEIDRKLEKVDNMSWNDLADNHFGVTTQEYLPPTVLNSALFDPNDCYSYPDGTVFYTIAAREEELEPGATYLVDMDGTTHRCLCKLNSNGDQYVGDGYITGNASFSTGEPFLVRKSYDGRLNIIVKDSYVHTIKMEKETAKPIDYSVLPSALQYGYTPHYLGKVTYDGQTNGKEFFNTGSSYYYKVSDLVVLNPKSSYSCVYVNGDTTTEGVAKLQYAPHDNCWTLYVSGGYTAYLIGQRTLFNGTLVEPGIYFGSAELNGDNIGTKYISEITFEETAYTFKQIEQRYLPQGAVFISDYSSCRGEDIYELARSGAVLWHTEGNRKSLITALEVRGTSVQYILDFYVGDELVGSAEMAYYRG